MKIRHGFVSNSSSTSFVIGIRSLDLNIKPPWLAKFFNKQLETLLDNAIKINTIQELDDHFIYVRGWRENETIKEVLEENNLQEYYKKIADVIDKGIDVYFAEILYGSPGMVEFLESLPRKYDKESGMFLIENEDWK